MFIVPQVARTSNLRVSSGENSVIGRVATLNQLAVHPSADPFTHPDEDFTKLLACGTFESIGQYEFEHPPNVGGAPKVENFMPLLFFLFAAIRFLFL